MYIRPKRAQWCGLPVLSGPIFWSIQPRTLVKDTYRSNGTCTYLCQQIQIRIYREMFDTREFHTHNKESRALYGIKYICVCTKDLYTLMCAHGLFLAQWSLEVLYVSCYWTYVIKYFPSWLWYASMQPSEMITRGCRLVVSDYFGRFEEVVCSKRSIDSNVATCLARVLVISLSLSKHYYLLQCCKKLFNQ